MRETAINSFVFLWVFFLNFILCGQENPYAIELKTETDTSGILSLYLGSEEDAAIYYTLNGDKLSSDDPVFIDPIDIDQAEHIKYGMFRQGKLIIGPYQNLIFPHRAIGKKSELRSKDHDSISKKNKDILLDGILGNKHPESGQWLAFTGEDMIFVIDLGDFEYINSVKLHFLNFPKEGIFLPEIVKFYYSGNDINYRQLGEVKYQQHDPGKEAEILEYQMDYPWIESRYIMVIAENLHNVPHGFVNKNAKATMLLDEVIVE